MFGIKILGVALLAVPAIALAQVGPNPAVPGGSQSPTMGGSSDMMTVPQDARVGPRASGQVLDRTTTTRTDTTTTGAGVDAGVARPGSTATPETDGAISSDASTAGTGTSVGTETRTKTRTRSMEKRRR